MKKYHYFSWFALTLQTSNSKTHFMKSFFLFLLLALLTASCDTTQSTATGSRDADTSAMATVRPADWKFGVALWTFHDVNFPTALDRVDSAGLKYIEPNTFHSAGPELKDSMIMQLSPTGIQKLRELIANKGLICESIYIVGDSTLSSWVKQFDIAKQFGVKFVTTEPPLDMWDSIDSLAGAYSMKVAIHEHWKGVSHYWNPDTTLLALQGHPNFGVCADLGHWPKSGINPLDAVKKLSGHIIALHFKDISAYDNPRLKDVVTGTGVVDFPKILAELAKQNFTGNIYIERDSVEPGGNLSSVKQELEYYNKLISNFR
jgi:sugar phosphate isomerase/epimerase